jgi:ferredoxin
MKIKRIKIDRERCVGCGSCAIVAPDAFVLDINEGKAEVKEGWEKVPPNDLRRARDICPVQAIVLEEIG